MPAAVETMAYAGNVPWHGLGNTVDPDTSPEDMLVAAGLDWHVLKQKMYSEVGEAKILVPDHFSLIRDRDQSVLGICGRDYIPTQNAKIMEFFQRWTKAGGMKLETAGSLYHGRWIWALAKLPTDFTLAGGDVVNGYLLLSSPHIWGKALQIRFTTIRVVCMNTLMMALGGRGSQGEFRMPHRMEFSSDVMRTAEEALGMAGDQMQVFSDSAKLLAKVKCDAQDYYKYLTQLFGSKKDLEETEGTVLTIADLKRNAYDVAAYGQNSPGRKLKSADGTWWGAVNDVTYWVDHKSGRDRDTALNAAWFGSKAKLKEQAFDLAVEYAKAA